MKDNNAYDRGFMKGDAQTLGAHALYLARFVEEYEKEGIPVAFVMPQNEAGYPQDYPSCEWTSSVMVDYIGNHLGPLFQQRGVPAGIWAGTYSNPTNDNTIGNAVMSNSTAAGYIDGIGLQWGMQQHASTYVGSYASRVDNNIMQTEHQCGNYPWEGGYQQTAPNDHAYGVESWGLMSNWIKAGVNSYLAWNMVLDSGGRSLDTVRPWAQNALITVSGSDYRLTPYFHVFRHFANFVDPGAHRVDTSGSFGEVIAFENPDGSVVAVLYNSGSARQMTLAGKGTTVSFSVPANGWATVNLQ